MSSPMILQRHSYIPVGNFTISISNFDRNSIRDVQTLRQVTDSVSSWPHLVVGDFVRLSQKSNTTLSTTETALSAGQVRFLSLGWEATANYHWLIPTQSTPALFLGAIEGTVRSPTNVMELMNWFWIVGLAGSAVFGKKDQETQVSNAAGVQFVLSTTVASFPANHTITVTRNKETKWIEKLEILSKLAPGWNRQGAPAPNEAAIRAARPFIEATVNDSQPPTRVAASAVGGVGVTRKVGERMAYIEFYNDGAACGLLADDLGYEQILEVPLEGGPFTNLLDEIKAYLNG
jgi:hypothetical protein